MKQGRGYAAGPIVVDEASSFHSKTGAEILEGIEQTKAEWDQAVAEHLARISGMSVVDVRAALREVMQGQPEPKAVQPVICYRAAMLVKAQRVARWLR